MANCRGFVYATALMGVTGARNRSSRRPHPTWSPGSAPSTRRCRSGVGLGVGNGAQAAEVAAFADGVIVGSALVRCVLDASDPAEGERRLRALSTELAEGVRNRPS